MYKLRLTHNVHASKLRPNLGKETNMGAVEHSRLEKIKVGNVGVLTLKFAHVLDILEFVRDKWVVRIPFTVDKRKNGVAILPPVFASQPSRRLGQKQHHAEKEYCGDHLKTPRNSPSSCLVVCGLIVTNVSTTVGDVVHDQDAPCNGPLLETNEATTLGRGRNFGDIDGDLGGLDSDGKTVDHTTNNEHTLGDGGARNDGANHPGSSILVTATNEEFTRTLGNSLMALK